MAFNWCVPLVVLVVFHWKLNGDPDVTGAPRGQPSNSNWTAETPIDEEALALSVTVLVSAWPGVGDPIEIVGRAAMDGVWKNRPLTTALAGFQGVCSSLMLMMTWPVMFQV